MTISPKQTPEYIRQNFMWQRPVDLEGAVAAGMIPLQDLEDGVLYAGTCRNAQQARWDAARQKFVYKRTKFGSTFNEDINHPEHDDGYDLFVPTSIINETSENQR